MKHLRLSCKAIAEILYYEVFRTVSLEVSKENMERGVRKIETLATARHPACTAARVLSIGILSPASSRALSLQWRAESRPEDHPEAIVARESLNSHLFDAISSLKGVYSVK